MAPKKKSKKQDDDWEAELGESIAPATENADAPPNEAEDEEPAATGGLMALLRKKKEKRKKAGLSEDFPAEEPQEEEPVQDLTAKAPVEADLDDEFALPEKKGKGGKGKQQPAAKNSADGPEETDASGRVLTKAEKEKAKKEREKQRKKEQVGALSPTNPHQKSCPKETNHVIIGCQEEACHQGRNCKTCRGQEGGASPRSRPSRWYWWQEAPKGTPTAPGTARCTQEARRRACTSGC